MVNAAVFCPAADDQMKSSIRDMKGQQWVDEEKIFDGRDQIPSLKDLPTTDTLYIICHGHPVVPVFFTKLGFWTGPKMAELLKLKGINQLHREIVLLVCNAGASVSDERSAKSRMKTFEEVKKAQNKFGEDSPKFQNALSKLMSYEHEKQQFGHVSTLKTAKETITWDKKAFHETRNRTLPLAAEFVQGLKRMQSSTGTSLPALQNVRVTSYMMPVDRSFGKEPGNVALDLSSVGGRSTERNSEVVLKYTSVWH